MGKALGLGPKAQRPKGDKPWAKGPKAYDPKANWPKASRPLGIGPEGPKGHPSHQLQLCGPSAHPSSAFGLAGPSAHRPQVSAWAFGPEGPTAQGVALGCFRIASGDAQADMSRHKCPFGGILPTHARSVVFFFPQRGKRIPRCGILECCPQRGNTPGIITAPKGAVIISLSRLDFFPLRGKNPT